MADTSIWSPGVITVPQADASGTYLQQSYDATAGQTVFNLTSLSYIPSTNALDVYINGVKQETGKDYDETSSTRVTLVEGCLAGDRVVIRGLVGITGEIVDLSASVFLQSGTGATSRSALSKLRESFSVKDFGAVGDGSTDDTAAIQAAINEVYARGGGVVDCSGGRWLIDSADLIVKQGVVLEGPWSALGETDGTNWTTTSSAFILNSTYTIRLAQEFSGIKGMGIFRKGLTNPTSLAEATIEVAAFAGKAITVGYGAGKDASDTYAGYCFILGFQYAYYNDFNERPRVEFLSGDCTNGVYLNQIYDCNHLTGCHFWPFVTTHNAWTFTGDAGWRRQGTAYYFGLGVDWGQALNCFSYGYDNGFYINGSDNVVLLNCGADGYKDNNTYSVGYRVEGTTKNLNLIGCKAAAKNTSVLIDISGGGNSQCVKITGGNLWACSTSTGSHVYLKNGFAILSGGLSMFDGPFGVKTDSTAKTISVIGCIFQSITTPYSISNMDNANIFGNSFNGSTDGNTGSRLIFDNQQSFTSESSYSASSGGVSKYGRKSRGTVASPDIINSNDASYAITGQGWDGAAWQSMGNFRLQVQGTPSAGVMPGAFVFATSNGSGVTDRIILHSQGYLYPLTDNSTQFGSSTNRWSAIWAANGTIQTSDLRTKENISDASLGLSFINQLRPVSYTWKVGGREVIRQIYRDEEGNECDPSVEGAIPGEIITRETKGNRTHWGLIAQEVKQATDSAGVDFAGWVLTDKGDPDSQQALRYDQFIAPLIKAVQELSSKVKTLEITITELTQGYSL